MQKFQVGDRVRHRNFHLGLPFTEATVLSIEKAVTRDNDYFVTLTTTQGQFFDEFASDLVLCEPWTPTKEGRYVEGFLRRAYDALNELGLKVHAKDVIELAQFMEDVENEDD